MANIVLYDDGVWQVDSRPKNGAEDDGQLSMLSTLKAGQIPGLVPKHINITEITISKWCSISYALGDGTGLVYNSIPPPYGHISGYPNQRKSEPNYSNLAYEISVEKTLEKYHK